MAEPRRTAPRPVGLLTVDCGNTTLDCMMRTAAGDERRERLAHGDGAGLRALLDAQPEAIVAASVVPGGLDALEAAARAAGVPVLVAGSDLPCPLRIAYTDPGELGVDRWVAAYAAWRMFSGPVIAIDCGTAVTVDLVDASGCFRGGMIGPGAGTMAHGLRVRAPALPPAALDADVASVPINSCDAVNAGVLLSFCGGIERAATELAEGAGADGPYLVLTGGEADVYVRHGRLPVQHVPDLVHRGLVELWQQASR